jgi:hypothetical protein
MKKFIAGTMLGGLLFAAGTLYGQREREFHPRLARAVEALRDARAYIQDSPHDFGGHKREALRATDEAIRQLNFAIEYRDRR